MVRKTLSFVFLISFFMVGCGRGFVAKTLEEGAENRALPFADPTVPTYEKVGEELIRIKPQENVTERLRLTKYDEKEEPVVFQKIHGGLDIRSLKHSYDPSKKEMQISGDVIFTIDDKPVVREFVLTGAEKEKEGRIYLVSKVGSAEFKDNFKAVVFNCFEDSCEDFYIQFLYYVPGLKRVYIEQVFPEKLVAKPVKKKDEGDKDRKEKEKKDKEQKEEAKKREQEQEQEPKEEEKPDEEQEQDEETKKEEEKEQEQKEEEKPEEKKEEEPEVVVEEDDLGGSQVLIRGAGLDDDGIIDQFPQIKEVQTQTVKEIKEKRKKPKPPAPVPGDQPPQTTPDTPQETDDDLEPEIMVKPLDPGTENYPPEVKKILEPISVGVDQAHGYPHRGRLLNGVNLLPISEKLGPLAGFRIIAPDRKFNFGTSELVSIVTKIGQWVHRHVPNFSLDVRTMSHQKGGLAHGHKSHQNGTDADIGYIFDENNSSAHFVKASSVKGTVKETFMADKQWELFKALFNSDQIEFILVSKPVKQAICAHVQKTQEYNHPNTAQATKRILSKIADTIDSVAHDTHFHLRIKCGPKQSSCIRWGIGALNPCPKR